MELIYVKEVDKSLLYQGFTIRTALLNSFLGIFGKLDIGEMRQISILLNGKIYSGIKVVNQNFDRNKFPNHPEMYQVRYDNMNDFLQALRSEFSDLYNFIDEQMKIKKIMKERGENMSNIKIPQERHYKIFCVNGNTGFRNESRIFYFIHLQNEEDYERKESSSA